MNEKELEIFNREKDTLVRGKKLTNVRVIEGVGVAKAYGELDLEGLVKRLLKSKAITG
jgi:hypothetical protein